MSGELELDAISRTQWQGIEGNPRQVFVSLNSPVYPLNGGVGIQFSSDKAGLRSTVGGALSYNYVMDRDFGLISLGVGLGYKQFSFDRGGILTPDGSSGDGRFGSRDDLLDESLVDASFLNYTLAVLYANGPLEIGLSYYQDLNSDEAQLTQSNGVLNLYSEYSYSYSEELDIVPYLFAKTNSFALAQYELGLGGVYLDRFSGGIGIRGLGGTSVDAILANMGVRISEKVSFAYYYDAGISSLASKAEGSHELMLRYSFGQTIYRTRPVKTIYNPRY